MMPVMTVGRSSYSVLTAAAATPSATDASIFGVSVLH